MLKNKQQRETENDKSKKKINFRWIWGGIFLFLMMVWLTNILFNWLFPDSLTISLTKINQLSSSQINNQSVHDYIQQKEGLQDTLTRQLNKVTDKSSINELEGMKKVLSRVKVETKEPVLSPLKQYYQNQIELGEKLIDKTIQNKKHKSFITLYQIRQLKKEYNANVPNEQKIIMALVKKAQIPYYEY